MWDEAAPLGKETQKGDYYFIGNNRMKISRGGYIEATFCKPEKLRKIQEDAAEYDENFKALLE